jgi:predicted transposase/invertase (TIGR01784 family)
MRLKGTVGGFPIYQPNLQLPSPFSFFQRRMSGIPPYSAQRHPALATAKRDGVFKALLEDQKKATSFINAVLDSIEAPRITGVVYKDTHFPGFTSTEKDIIADVVCESQGPKPEIYVIEMQRALQPGYLKRWLYTASRAYSSGLMTSSKYEHLKGVHVIALMEHPIDLTNDTYELTGKKSKAVIDKLFKMSLYSLSSIGHEISREDKILDKWLHFIKYSGTPHLNIEVLSTEPVLLDAIQHARALYLNPPPPIVEEPSRGTSWKLLNHRIKGI